MYKRQKRKEKHIYLVLDDWDKGFTIRKIDADSPDDDLILSSDSEPPVLRLLSPNPIHRMAFAAMGSSHIIAASTKHWLHEDGYIGAGQAASPTPTSTLQMQQLGWKMAGDKLWSKERLVEQPTLTCMGGARFCIVACVLSEGKKSGYSDPCMLNITTFRLRYSHKGELQIFERVTKSCQMYKTRRSFSPVAFWM